MEVKVEINSCKLKQCVVGEKEASPVREPVWQLRKTEQPSINSLSMLGTMCQWAPPLASPNATRIQIVTKILHSGGAVGNDSPFWMDMAEY